MRRTLAAALLLLAVGCSQAQEVTSKTADCAALARDAVDVRVNAPSAAELDRQVRRLDERIRSLNNADVRAAAERLRDAGRKVADAVRSGDQASIDRAVAEFREAASGAARACNLPVDRFRG